MNQPSPAATSNRTAWMAHVIHESRWYRLIVMTMALGALAFAWANMAFISRTDPWYRNTDMNIHNMADALAINSSQSPNTVDQPGLPLKFLLALDFRVRHYLGLLPVWNLRKFGASPNPLREIAPLIRAERVHSRILVLTFILASAVFTYAVTREMDAACLTVLLLCGNSGLLFHGQLIRPELLCVGLGNVLGLLCVWQATCARSWRAKNAWLFAAGVLGGLATFEKLPGVCYLVLIYAWCWLSALLAARREDSGTSPRPLGPVFWRGLGPAVAGVSVLWLLFQLTNYQDVLGPVVVQRLRTAAVITGLLPLAALWFEPNRFVRFVLDRGEELAVLAAGALATLPLGYLLLRGVMTEPAASTYLARVLHFLINPVPTVNLFLSAKPDVGREFMVFLREAPVLVAGAFTATIAVSMLRAVPLRLKALICLLLIGSLGLTLLLCRRYFADQYSIFLHVPLLLAVVFSVSGFGMWWRQSHPVTGAHWTRPLVLAAAIVIALTIYPRLEPKYTLYRDDVSLPVSDLTLTFIFDHDAHPQAYLQIMKEHYGTRAAFTKTLDQYLANPANRY